MGSGWDPEDALSITGPPGPCWGPDRGVRCPIRRYATVIYAAGSGHGDHYRTACPICMPNGYRYSGIEGVWVGDHWVHSTALTGYAGQLGRDVSGYDRTHHLADPPTIDDLYVELTIAVARAAYPDATPTIDDTEAVRRWKSLPHYPINERQTKSLRAWRDDVCGVQPFPPPPSIGPHRWVRATHEIEWLVTCLACGRSAGPADRDDEPECPGGNAWPEGWDYTWVVAVGPDGPVWCAPDDVGDRTVITPPPIDLGQIGKTPPTSFP